MSAATQRINDLNEAATAPRRAIVDPWKLPSASDAASTSTTRPRPAIVDPWAQPAANEATPAPQMRKPTPKRSWGEAAVDRAMGIGAAGLDALASTVRVSNQRTPLDSIPGGATAFAAGEAVTGLAKLAAPILPDAVNRKVDEGRAVLAAARAADPQNLTPRSEFAASFADTAAGYARDARAVQSDKEKTTQARLAEAAEEGFLPALKELATNPSALATAADSLPSMLAAGGGAGGVARTLATRAGVGAAAAGRIATGTQLGTMATLEGAGAGQGAYDAVMDAKQEVLDDDPAYLRLLEHSGDPARARQALAQMARSASTGTGTAASLALMGLGERLGLNVVEDAMLGKALRGAGSSRIGNAVGAGAREFMGEAAEGAANQLAQNVGAMTGGVEDDPLRGVGGAAAMEGAVGALAGGVRGMATTPAEAAQQSVQQPAQSELLALPPPGADPIVVAPDGTAYTAQQREALGLTPDVLAAQRQRARSDGNLTDTLRQQQETQLLADIQSARTPEERTAAETALAQFQQQVQAFDAGNTAPFPDATPGTMADAANAIPQAPQVLPDGSPVPDPAGGPLSRAVNQGVVNGDIPVGPRTWEQMVANIHQDARDTRLVRQKERDLDRLARDSRLPVALFDAEQDATIREASGQNAVESEPSAMQLAMQRAQQGGSTGARAPIIDPWANVQPQIEDEPEHSARVREDRSVGTPTDPSSPLAAPITPPWSSPTTGETSTPMPDLIRAAVEQQVAAQYQHNGKTALNSAMLSKAWGVPQKEIARVSRQVRAGFDPAAANEVRNAHITQPAPEIPSSTRQADMSAASAPPQPQPVSAPAPAIVVEPLGKRLALHGDATEVRARLKAAGFKGRIAKHPDGFLHVDQKYRPQVEAALSNGSQERFETGDGAPGVSAFQTEKPTDSRPPIRDPFREQPPATTSTATHTEPGQPPQPATPAVVAESAATVARAPNITMRQAKADVLAQLDAAMEQANTDPWPDLPDGTSQAARDRRQAAENERDRITQAAGYVTFDVPGDGTFRVVNNRERLEAFRSQVERQFKNTRPRGPQPARLTMSAAERARIMAEAETLDDDTPMLSRASVVQGQPGAKGLPVANVERIAQDFMRSYRGNIPLDVKVGRTLEELYGPNAAKLGTAKGAYHPRSRVLTLAADRLSSRADVQTTLRHEVLGHYGLNTLAPADKREILDAILSSRTRRSLAPLWADIDARYADMPESIRAEEVFAELASRERGTLGEWWDKVLALLAKALRNVGLLRGGITRAELHDLARRIGEGIRSGDRTQQTFPASDQEQFESRDASKMPSGVGTLSEQELDVLRQLGLLSPEQETDLSGQLRNTDDQPTNRWGERLIPEAEARTHLRTGARGTRSADAGGTGVPVGGDGSAAGRAGEHLQLPDGAAGQPGTGLRSHPDDERTTRGLLGLVRRLSESASDQLAGVPTAARHLDSRVGPFSGVETRARIKNAGTPQEALVIEVRGTEQIAAGLDEEPALTWTVNTRTGELDVNGPNPERATFRAFEKRGWADHARGQDGGIAVGWTALTNPGGSATLPIRQIIPMLADVHARYRAHRKEDRVGLRWSRITGATGGAMGREASVFFSRGRIPARITDAQRAALGKIGSFATPESLPKRARRVLGDLRRELVQGVFDQFQPIKALDEDAYMQARLSRGTDGVLEGLFLHGTPFLRDGAFDVKPDGQGLRGVLSGLQGEHDLFLAWIAGNRAAQLKAQGREHLFSGKEIQALRALNQGRMPDGSDRSAAYRKALAGYNRYQKAVLDIGEKAGLYSAEGRNTWESEFYIPFFRDFDAEHNEPSPYREPGTQKVIQQLEGGVQPLGDLLTNVLENHSRILTASMRNLAADKALAAAEKAGLAGKVEVGSKDTHRVLRQGKPVHYRVEDAPLVDALTMLHFNGDNNKTVQVLGTFKRALSFGVTISPGFRIRNLLRDVVSAMALTNAGYNPIRNLVDGWQSSGRGSPTFERLLAGGGAVRFGTLNDGAQSAYARRLIATGVNPHQILDTPAKVKRALQAGFQWWQDLGDRGETVNRAVIYERAMAQGANHLQASYQARDLLDFTAGGKWAAVRFLSQTVPFFNARLQGIYKLGRGARQDPKRFATVVGAVALASAALYLLQHDDDEYRALPDWARDTYWCINIGGTMLFVPKPFEVGALGTVVERGTELMLAGEDYQARDFANSLVNVAVDQLAMNPVPQAVKPLLEVAFNRDTFRGRPIDGMGMERLPAGDRHTTRTSTAAVLAGQAMNVSPQRIEHLARGYFGWLGLQALNVSDILMRPLTDRPSNPAHSMHTVSNWPVVGEFLRDSSSVSSKYVERFYAMQRQNEQLYAAYSAARAAGDIDRAMALEGTDAVRFRKAHNLATRQMQDINRDIRRVTADPTLDAGEKGELLTHFQGIRNQIAERADQMARAR